MHTTNLPKVGDAVGDGRLVAEQQRRALYTLDELLTQCAAFVKLSGGAREWLAAKPVGNELLSWGWAPIFG